MNLEPRVRESERPLIAPSPTPLVAVGTLPARQPIYDPGDARPVIRFEDRRGK